MKELIKKLLKANLNEGTRDIWIEKTLTGLPKGLRLLDAGAGELRNKPFCSHLEYVSQDICEYEGSGDEKGLQTGTWDTSNIDIICDIASIPEPDESYDVVLCSEVLEHVADPVRVLDELIRLTKPGGMVIVTAPFASFVHFAPYHFASGFSRYWYESHMERNNMKITELTPNGDWFTYCRQEILRLPQMARRYKDWCWPLTYVLGFPALLYFSLRGSSTPATDVACFGWHCIAVKGEGTDA